MHQETEIWGELTQVQFEAKLGEFSAQFGQPHQSRRLSLQADCFDRHDLDTRIRITDGTAELVQKLGAWDAKTRQEIRVPLQLDATGILDLYRVLINQLPAEHRQTNLIQYHNFIFDIPDYEIKLGKQAGKSTVYHYELETKEPDSNLETIRQKLDLPPALIESNETFWAVWNERVNFSYSDLSEPELLELIEQYLVK